MKKSIFRKTATALAIALVAMTGCDETQPSVIELDQSALPRTAWADEMQGSKQVTFVAPAAWTSSIADTPAAKATAGTSSVKAATGNWVTISPESGQAGANSVTVTLLPNYTGEARSATVTITSGGQTVSFVISQDGKKEDGTVPEDPSIPAEPDNLLTFDGQAYQIVRTVFHPAKQWVANDPAVNTWLHTMQFYTSSGFYLELSLVTGSETFTGGAFTFGDIQVNNMNKATGTINLPNAAGTMSQEPLAWGPELRVVRADDNTLTVEFNKVPAGNTKKEVSMKFSGPFENTDTPADFVPVRNIAFPIGHALTTLTANLNTLYQLSDGIIEPATATNRHIIWKAENALINGSTLAFGTAGTATVTATISEGMLGADGTKVPYTQTWTVTVGNNTEPDPEKVITFNGTQHPIVKAEHTVASYTSRDGSFTAKCHKFRFYINSSRYAEVTIVNNNDELTSDQYVFGDYSILNVVGTAEAFFNFTTATGSPDYAAAGGKVRVVRGDANGSNGNTRVEFMYNDVTTQAGNLPIKLLYVGKLTETGSGDPGYDPDPEKPALGQLYVNQTSFNLTECVVSFNYQMQLMSITFTGNNCSLALETYVNHTDEAVAPTLDGTFTVRYLTADRPYWDERFDNVFTKAYVSATGPASTWGNWQSGLREGTQITVKLNSQKINLSMQQALVNGVDDRTVSLEYDNVYVRK